MKKLSYIFFTTALLFPACDKEYLNPSTATEEQITNNVNGLISLANGLQYKYSVTRLSPAYTLPTASGLLAKELSNLNPGNTDEQLLMQGGAGVLGNNQVLSNLWNQSLLVVANANLIFDNLNIVTDPGTVSGLYAHAALFKALALGNLAVFWEQAPVTIGKNAPFVSRSQVLNEAITLLEKALVEYAKAPSLSSQFTTRIVSKVDVPTGIDYPNAINALIARYALMNGDYNKAIAASDLVLKTSRSGLRHDDISRNALYEIHFQNRNVAEPVTATYFGLPAGMTTPAGDQRINFFYNFEVTTPPTNRGKASFYNANTATVPLYRVGEMYLIKAEALVRKLNPDLTGAVQELDNVLTKTPATDPWGIGANLPAYAGGMTAPEILDEIYKQRCIELYLTGLRFEDSRRFGRPATERGNRTFLPYPFTERDNNTSTPADPAS
jgi:starch-binding outer membrane protein, SusD/RagB family